MSSSEPRETTVVTGAAIRELVCYRLSDKAPQIVPARSDRAWMNSTRQRYAYRCLPLTIANSMGWELLSPTRVTAEWTGGSELSDVVVESDADGSASADLAASHFGHGILTFHTGYLFRTEPGVGLWARGIPNLPKDGIAPLDGIVETDWLEFSFTMNWMFTRPGRVTFERDEPFCFLTPIAYRALDDLVPEVRPIDADAEMLGRYKRYADMRATFNDKLAQNDAATLERAWQKWYMRGESPVGGPDNPLHVSKLRLAQPRVTKASDGSSGE